jgi:hypothetical protein
MCRANLQRPVAQSIYSRRRSTDQSGAGLFATARTLLVLSASLMSFASRLFFGALSICLRLHPRSTNEGLVIWCGLIVSLALFMFIRRSSGRGMAPSSFRRERPRANPHARSLRPPMGRHSRSMGGLKGVPPTSRHPGGCQRSQLAPGKPRVWPLVQLF